MDDMFQNYTPDLPGQASDLEAVTPQPDRASRLAFRVLRQLQAQPHSAQAAALILAGDGSDVPASRIDGLTVRVAAPSPHAGRYRVSLAALARGPVCLVPPALRDVDGEGAQLVAEAGLWVTDAARGQPVVLGQWLADGEVLDGAAGMALTLDDTHAGCDIAYAETVRQGGFETVGVSAGVAVPGNVETPGSGEDSDPEEAPEPEKPVITLRSTPEVTLEAVLSGDEPVRLSITAPPEYAGTYTLDPADLAAGPVALVPVAVSGNRYLGDTLAAPPVLWVHDAAAGPLVVTRQWFVGDDPVEDAGVLTHTRATLGVAPRYVETATDSRGSRSSIVETATTVAIGELPDTFTAPDGTALGGYIGESGLAWRMRVSGSNSAGRIADGRVRSEWSNNHTYVDRFADLPADQFAEGVMVTGSGAGAWDSGVGLAVRIDPAANSYYRAHYNGTHWRVAKIVGGTQTVLAQQAWANPGGGIEVPARLEARGNQLALLIDGVALLSATDGSIAGGRAGLGVNSASPAGTRMEITQFHAGGL